MILDNLLISSIGFILYITILFFFAIKAMFLKGRRMYPLGIALLLGIAIAILYNMNIQAMANILFGILLFNLVLSKELEGIRIVVAVIGLLFLLVFSGEGASAIGISIMLGMSSELFSERGYESHVDNKEIEIRRDFVHLFGGVILFVAFLFFGYPTDGYIIQYVFIIGILLVFYAELWRSSRFSMSLYRIEKHKDYVGYGAVWLGIGTLIAYTFMDKRFFLLALLAIYFADPAATFAGSYRPFAKLPHNRKKSVVGSLSYFAIVAIPGYLIVGPIAILFALVGAIVESLPIKLDDNFSVSLILTLLYLILLYSSIL